MIKRDVVVIGASAGSMEMLLALVSGLPSDLSASVLLVLHIPAYAPSRLREILERVSAVPVIAPTDGEPLVPGRIYVPTPDRHLLVEENRIRVTRGPKENRARPAVDALFRSAAYSFGPRTIGIVLSGNLDDGTAGLWAIKDQGGIAIVQSPEEAQFPSMPQSALEHVDVDYVLPVADMPSTILRLAQEAIMPKENNPKKKSLETEVKTSLGDDAIKVGVFELGAISPLACPECHGVLLEIQEGAILRYRCHTGHGFSSQALFGQTNQAIDTHIGNALRAVEEQMVLLRKMEKLATAEGNAAKKNVFSEQIDRAEKLRILLRSLVTTSAISV